MAVYVVGLVFFLALVSYSDANYCVCNTGLSDSVLQKNIDYACGNGADCSQINQNGACFNPNTVHDHCNYAVNSYYQKKASLPGSCDFSGTATITSTPPATAGSGCVYPSSGSSNTGGSTTPPSTGTPTGGTTPPSTGTPTGGTPLTPTTPSMGGTPTTPGSGTFPGGGSTTPGSPGTPGFGLGPTGSGGFGNTDSSAGPKLLSRSSAFTTMFVASMSAFVCAMI